MPRKIVAKAIEDDVEGHRRPLPRVDGSDDTEGHRKRLLKATGTEDDTEGHRKRLLKATGTEDDTEGHARKTMPRVDGTDEDTEGHSFIPDPLSSRILAQAREREIQGRMREKSMAKESRNPFRRSKS